MKTIGELIRELRKEKDIKQMVLAKEIGISQNSLSQIETDLKKPHPKTFIKILDILDISEPAFYILMISEEDVIKKNREMFNTIHPIFKKIITNK